MLCFADCVLWPYCLLKFRKWSYAVDILKTMSLPWLCRRYATRVVRTVLTTKLSSGFIFNRVPSGCSTRFEHVLRLMILLWNWLAILLILLCSDPIWEVLLGVKDVGPFMSPPSPSPERKHEINLQVQLCWEKNVLLQAVCAVSLTSGPGNWTPALFRVSGTGLLKKHTPHTPSRTSQKHTEITHDPHPQKSYHLNDLLAVRNCKIWLYCFTIQSVFLIKLHVAFPGGIQKSGILSSPKQVKKSYLHHQLDLSLSSRQF